MYRLRVIYPTCVKGNKIALECWLAETLLKALTSLLSVISE